MFVRQPADPLEHFSLTSRGCHLIGIALEAGGVANAARPSGDQRNELAIGWIGHYAVGILYGFVYVPLMRNGLGLEPSLLNGLVFGVLSTVVPWFFFMPAMGAGVLANKAPNPLLA